MWTRTLLLSVVMGMPVLLAAGPAQAGRDDDRSRVAVKFEQRWGDHDRGRDKDRGHDRGYDRGYDRGPDRHVEVRHEKVLVAEAYTTREWVPAVYEQRRDACGRPYMVLVREGYYREVCVPARYEYRPVRCEPPPPVCPPPRPRHERSGISIIFSTRW